MSIAIEVSWDNVCYNNFPVWTEGLDLGIKNIQGDPPPKKKAMSVQDFGYVLGADWMKAQWATIHQIVIF